MDSEPRLIYGQFTEDGLFIGKVENNCTFCRTKTRLIDRRYASYFCSMDCVNKFTDWKDDQDRKEYTVEWLG